MGSLLPPRRFHIKSIAIIGAGPSGLAAASYLIAQAVFDRIVIFEQQLQISGVWNYSPLAPPPVTVPQTDPFLPPEPPLRSSSSPPLGQHPSIPVFPSPMYDKLHANLTKNMMSFHRRPFGSESRLFPSREDIQRYLLDYAQPLRPLIRLGYQVTDISPLPQPNQHDRWRLQAQSVTDETSIDETFDAIVVANGHYTVPYVPPIENMAAFQRAYPTAISHARQYRSADAFRDKKTIVVGNGPSGVDIALQINQESKGKTLLSVRTATPPERLAHIGCREVFEIDAFLVEQRGVRFKDGSIETDVDAVVFCTGYLFSFPFLRQLQTTLVTDGFGVHNLYKHLFCIRHPTLALASLLVRSVPWPMAEAQAAALAAVWSNNLPLPPLQDMQKWSRGLEEVKGRKLQLLPPGGDYEYINDLYDWVVKAEHLGKEPPRWIEEDLWQRTIMLEAKRRFEAAGCKAFTLQELGLQYDAGY